MGSLGRTLSVLVISGLASAVEKQQEPATTTYSPQELVRRMVEMEVRAQEQDPARWRFTSRTEQSGKVVVSEKVQTSGGTLKRIVSLNHRSPSSAEVNKEEQRLEELLHDPAAQAKKLRAEREDAEKAKKMFRLFPEAFIYRYARDDQGLTRLHFVPNPRFDPPTREAMVFHAMTGMIWIEPNQMRFVKMQASLADEVKFGFGLLGHLDRGGTMVVEQREVAPGHWEIVNMDLNLKGKAVLLKSINIQEKEENYAFQRVSDTMDLARGAELLKNPIQTLACIGGK